MRWNYWLGLISVRVLCLVLEYSIIFCLPNKTHPNSISNVIKHEIPNQSNILISSHDSLTWRAQGDARTSAFPNNTPFSSPKEK